MVFHNYLLIEYMNIACTVKNEAKVLGQYLGAWSKTKSMALQHYTYLRPVSLVKMASILAIKAPNKLI